MRKVGASSLRRGVLALLLGLVVALAPTAAAQTGRLAVTDRQGKPVVLYEGSYALVIGVEKYAEGSGWPVLQGVPGDVEAVSAALRRHGFEVETVMNPDHTALKPALESFINRRGLVPGHRLLIYFAGHGQTLRQSYGEQMGYLVPTDALHPDLDKDRFLARAVSMAEVEVLARKIQAKHALFLFDSCFAGTIFTMQRTGEVPASISERVARPVRFFITAGKADEPVPDVSIFRRQVVAALDGEGDLYEDGYVTGMELGEFLYNKVTNYSRGQQHPQYGKIRHPGLDKGDFVFRIPVPELDTAATPKPPSLEEFSLEDLTARAAKIEALQQEWAAWQGRMQQAFEEVVDYAGRPVPAELKAQAWQRFLDAYPQDNPYSGDDESLRASAREELTRWQAAAVAPGGEQAGSASPQAGDRKLEAIGGAELALRYIPAGEFRMGSPTDEPDRDDDETPHQVTLTRPFWMLETEVTQGQWQEVMGTTPSYFSTCGMDCPVERVSWYDAVAFANELSKLAGLQQCYEVENCEGQVGSGCANVGWCEGSYKCNEVKFVDACKGWRLPTEAEWEYAARAETETPFWTGDNLTTEQANYDGNYPYDGNSKGEYRQTTVAVRSLPKNRWGLYEVHGNVWEWVEDSADFAGGQVKAATYEGHQIDPLSGRGSWRGIRGGGWDSYARHCRSAFRYAGGPAGRSYDLGFRVVRTASE